MHGESRDAFAAAEPVIAGLVADEPQLRLVLTSERTDTAAFLRGRFPDERAFALPREAFLGRFIRRTRPGLLVLLDASLEDSARRRIAREGVRIVALGPPVIEISPGSRTLASGAASVDDVLGALRPLRPAAPERSLERAWIDGSLRDRIGQSRAWESASRWWRTKRIDDWERLAERLGHPRTILCLGNGPSSEEPSLAEYDHDCLMRVNWRWRDRDFLTQPDVVFVGDAATLHKVSPAVFGLWSRTIESAALLRHLATRGPRRMTYITLERMSPLIGERQWAARPTGGALMIVTAAALRPERLVIAGIDLFQHPDGRYPGDRLSWNAYSRCHDRDVEIELIDLALRDYPGELVIRSENLRRALEARREASGAVAG